VLALLDRCCLSLPTTQPNPSPRSALLPNTHPPPKPKVACYEDTRLLKLFCDIVKALYSSDLVAEDTIQHWYKKGSHPKGRNVFLKDVEPFIKWLDEAEEEEEDE
jgi:hypothetical protein